jgi:hypothetical protein
VLAFASLLTVFLVQSAPAERDKGAGVIKYECPEECNTWWIDVDQFGYSDWLEYDPPGPGGSHEMLSGEWAAAIYFMGIETPGATWLTDQFICPTFNTAQSFQNITWPFYTLPNSAGSMTIQHKFKTWVEIDIDYSLVCEGEVAMGIGGGPPSTYVPSDTCIAFVTYTIRNTSFDSVMTDVRFYQMLHGHPGNNYGPVVTGVYDPTVYPVLNYPNYSEDITMWAFSNYGDQVEYIGMSVDPSENPPINWEVSHFRGHGGKPATGTGIDIENQALTNTPAPTVRFGPDEVAGAFEWDIGIIEPGGQHQITVMLTMSSNYPTRIPSLTHWGLIILVALLILTTVYIILKRRRAAVGS